MSSPQQQSSPQQSDQQDDHQLIAAIAGMLIVGAGLAFTAKGISTLTRLPIAAVTGALEACGHPLPMSAPALKPSAYTATKAANRMFRAAFVLNASRRIAEGLKTGGKITDLVAREKSLWGQHRAATAQRLQTAKAVDTAAQTVGEPTDNGTLLGWYAVIDGRTDPTCVAADQTNFYAEVPPMIGYPGSVHMHCRCEPGPPWPGAKMTYKSSAVRQGPDATSFYTRSLK